MFIRHGEKPGENGPPHGINHDGEHDPHSLSVRGWTRAGALAGLLAGSLAVGATLSLYMANAGGAWDNAKKSFEK